MGNLSDAWLLIFADTNASVARLCEDAIMQAAIFEKEAQGTLSSLAL